MHRNRPKCKYIPDMEKDVDQRAEKIRVLRKLKKRQAFRRWMEREMDLLLLLTVFFLVTVYCVREKGLVVSGCVC